MVFNGNIPCPLAAIAFSRFAIIFKTARCAPRLPANAS
jgi:hypothetical protein